MKVRSWLSTCSTTLCTSTTDYTALSPPSSATSKHPHKFSDNSSMSTTTTSPSSSSSSSTTSTLQSNLSLQTLPSVPSLQNLSLQTLDISVTKTSVTTLRPHPFHVSFLAVHNNLLYATAGKFINVFDINTFTHLDTFHVKNPSSGSVKSVTFFDKTVFTASQDSKIRAWELTASNDRHKLITTLPTVKDRLHRFVLPKNYVRVRRHKKRLWIQHHDAVSGLAIFDQFLCSVSWDKYLKIWSASDFRCMQSIKAHDDAINAVVVAVDGTIYTASADRKVKVWGKSELSSGRKSRYGLIATLGKHKSAVNALALNEDGSVLFSGSCDRSILVWEREDSANYMVVTGALRGHGKAILCLINFNELLFSGSADRTVRIWQRGMEGKFCCLTVLDGHKKAVRSLAAAADEIVADGGGMKVFSGSLDGEIKVWEVVVSNLASDQRPFL